MTAHRTILALFLTSLALWSLTAQSDAPEKPPADTEAEGDKAEGDKAEGDKAEGDKAEDDKAEGDKAEGDKADDTAKEGATPTTDQATEEEAKPAAQGWWTPDAKEKEAALLQEIFNEMPKPEKKKGAGKLVYARNVPLVIKDIHNNTAVWGSKLQRNVHYVGISKIHTTSRIQPIGRDTPGIPFCPLACNRITDIFPHEADITIQYDGPIKDWAGKVADNVSGYTRQWGKAHKSKCSFPLMYPPAPNGTWLDLDKVGKVKAAVVAEIKRYCAE